MRDQRVRPGATTHLSCGSTLVMLPVTAIDADRLAAGAVLSMDTDGLQEHHVHVALVGGEDEAEIRSKFVDPQFAPFVAAMFPCQHEILPPGMHVAVLGQRVSEVLPLHIGHCRHYWQPAEGLRYPHCIDPDCSHCPYCHTPCQATIDEFAQKEEIDG